MTRRATLKLFGLLGLRAVLPANFGRTEQARLRINRWVAENTKDKIPELFAAGVLTRDALLVLTNAVYFKGKWADPFDKKATRVEPFHVSGDKTVRAPLMGRHGR